MDGPEKTNSREDMLDREEERMLPSTARNVRRGAVCPGARDDQGFDGIAGGSTKAASA
jgi:hypothetical protein